MPGFNDPIFLVSITASFLNLLLGLFVFLSNRNKLVNRLFFLLSINIIFWITSVIARFYITDQGLILINAKLSFFFATTLLYVLYLFSINFPYKKIKRVEITVVSVLAALTSLFSLSPLLVLNVLLVDSAQVDTYGPAYYLFIFYFIGLVFLIFWNLFQKRIRTTEKEKKTQIDYVLAGVLLSAIFAFSTNVLIPFFTKISEIAYLGPSTTLFFVGFSTIAILRHSLFNIKVVTTQVLVILLIIFTLVRALLSNTPQQLAINLSFFVFVSVIGVYLIRSVLKEVQAREHIERLAEDLHSANEQLQKISALKTEFVSVATHQLRGPLTAIKGYTSMILDGTYGEVPQDMQKPVERIHTSTVSLAQVVQDFLDVSRIEQGSIKYEMVAFDFADLTKEVVGELAPNIESANLNFTFSIEGRDLSGPSGDDGGKYIIRGDRLKLKQVVGNIIDNAVKYTKEGFIDVSLARLNGKIRLTVSDSGIGITEKTLKALFGKFERADGADEVNVSGTGLGLYIAKEIVGTHGGEIWAESEGLGSGSRFIIELPK